MKYGDAFKFNGSGGVLKTVQMLSLDDAVVLCRRVMECRYLHRGFSAKVGDARTGNNRWDDDLVGGNKAYVT